MSERMQSLLSRAVEDQLSEQRQIAGVLADLRAQLQRITSDIAALRADSGTAGPADTALASVSADVREAVRLLAERIDGVARLVQERGRDLAELRAAIEALQTSSRGHGEALGGLSSGLAALPAFGERIGGLQGNLAGLHERLAGLDHVGDAVTALQQRVDGVDQGLRELRSAFAAIGARMAELPGRADIDAIATRSAAPYAELGERISGLERAATAVAEQVTSLAEAPAAGNDVDALRAELARFAAATHDETAEVQGRLAGLDRRLDEVLEAVTADPPDADAGVADEDEDYAEDPVLTELADLREALLGEDGLAARVDAAGADDLDARVTSAVEKAVAASEDRLTAHIDEAVLALAEALLRRRGGRAATAAPAPQGAPTPAAAALAAEAPAEPTDEAEIDDAAQPADGGEPADPPEPTPWQTPTAPSEPPTPADPGDEPSSDHPQNADRRRRPWWRPGD
jgi:prefoldin subunit 5